MPLAKLLVALQGGNVSKVIGDKNITIQNVKGSNITINDISDLEQQLAKFIDRFNQPLYFVIFSDDTNAPHDWKPFGERSILELIQICMSNVKNTNPVLWFIDPSNPIDNEIVDDLKEIKTKSIVLFNTAFKYCPHFNGIFDHYEIGGCVAIPDKDPKDIILRTLINLRTEEAKMNRRKKTYNYALKNIGSDFDIMEAINNIVYSKGYKFSNASIIPKDGDSQSSKQLIQL